MLSSSITINSFVMASDELLLYFFFQDKANLKFSGTRKLVQNINRIDVSSDKTGRETTDRTKLVSKRDF